jgi:hypothetical protein
LAAAAASTRSRISASSAMRRISGVSNIWRRCRHLPARPLDPLAQRLSSSIWLILRPSTVATRLVAARHAAVALDAEEHERREHQQHEHELQDAGVATEEIEHGRCRCEKGEPWFAFRGRTARF